MHFVKFKWCNHTVSTGMATAGKKFRFILSESLDFYMINNLYAYKVYL